MVLLRELEARRLLKSEAGAIAVGWLVMEDLAIVLAIVFLPMLAAIAAGETGDTVQTLATFGLTLVKIAVFVVIEPDGADAASRIGEPDRHGDVGELSAVIAKQRIRPIAKGDEQVEIAVAIDVDPHRLPDGTRLDDQAGVSRDIGEPRAIVLEQLQHGPGARREADQQIGIAIGVVIAPGGGARAAGEIDAHRCGDVAQTAAIVAVEMAQARAGADEVAVCAHCTRDDAGGALQRALRKSRHLHAPEGRRPAVEYAEALR